MGGMRLKPVQMGAGALAGYEAGGCGSLYMVSDKRWCCGWSLWTGTKKNEI